MSWSLARASQGLRRPRAQCGPPRRRQRWRCTCRCRRSQLCRSMQLPAPRPALRRRPPRGQLTACLRHTRSARLQRLHQVRQSQREPRQRSQPSSQWRRAALGRREPLRLEVCLSRSVAGRRVAASGVSRRVGLRWPRGMGRAHLLAGNAWAARHGALRVQAGAAMTGCGCRERQERSRRLGAPKGQALGRCTLTLMRRLPRRTLRVCSPCANRGSTDAPCGTPISSKCCVCDLST